MDHTNWHKQGSGPLFPDLLWSKPENRVTAGKLLIIGGNLHGFAIPAEAYSEAAKAGIGTAKVLLPDCLQKTVGKVLENGEYAPSTPSGSFSKKALVEWLAFSAWADGVLIAGELGRNSETAIALEEYMQKFIGPVTITRDAVDYFVNIPKKLFERKNTTVVASLSQLQKMCSNLGFTTPILFSMTMPQLVDALCTLTLQYPCSVVTEHNGVIVTAVNKQVSTTKLAKDVKIWRVRAATHCAVWWLQNPGKKFEALSTAVFESVEQIK